MQILARRNLKPPLFTVREVTSGPEWDAEDINAFVALKEREAIVREQSLQSKEVDTEQRKRKLLAERGKLFQENRELFSRIHTKYLGATNEESDFLLSIQGRFINDLEGNAIYSFAVAGEEGASAPDVLALEQKVHQVFKES